MAETLDPSGQTVLKRGFVGGSHEISRMGMPPVDLLNVADSGDRQRVFYGGVADLGSNQFVFLNYWKPGGMMSALRSEFSVAISNAGRFGVNIHPDVIRGYDERITAYSTMMGLSSVIQHCDGTLISVAEAVPSEAVMDELGWSSGRAKLVREDPGVTWPLQWIRDHGDNGTLFYYWSEMKNNPASIEIYKDKLVEAMIGNSAWDSYRATHHIPKGVERDLVTIALNYWIVEDLPDTHRALKSGQISLGSLDLRVRAKIDIEKPDLGVMPFSDVFQSTFDEPTGILKAKHVFQGKKQERIIESVHNFFTFADSNAFENPMRGRLPSEMTVKDMKRYAAVWDLIVGGSQGTNLADFSKFGEAVFKLCNLYNGAKDFTGKAAFEDVVGWMVGEAVYAKTLAVLAGSTNRGLLEQIFKVVSLGDQDTPKELQAVEGGVLGTEGAGTFGAIAFATQQFGLRIGTEHYKQAVAMLKTGVPNPTLAINVGQPILIATALMNRLSRGVGGGKRR